ncbi:threonine synthase [Aerococcus sp. UMB8623]|uniref:threonine synthase n=1 Tax=Aerococcus sp. UMB8623 TaxID=3046348 RepID=UPI00254F65D0|nr:threonine synthase [Aerococcus sp. UMB8623]MDK6686934.1 threonine synthase [Aerococcus sp. UMB8623]
MYYQSTRNPKQVVSASQAILQGLAPDGGLYVPQSFPQLDLDWDQLKDYSYQEMAAFILSPFLDDYRPEDLRACIDAAYDQKFDDPKIAPLVQVGDRYHLELFHGATIAFKDMALSILPHLMTKAAEINHNDKEIIILTATSGDTGKAAMAGFADVPSTKIAVFYPEGGVSDIQEKQMLTQKGANTYVYAVKGNFDDAQTKVKALFNDPDLRQKLADQGAQFSSANSMNIGRLLPQVVYYFYAYAQLVKTGAITAGEAIDFTVPTGNFGNILAAYYGQRCGLPVKQLICASNDNKVLYDFFQTGTYNRKRDFKLTISPSMDILVSSNFERMLYHALGDDSQELTRLMDQLDQDGRYQVTSEELQAFQGLSGEYASEAETKDEIKTVFDRTGYLMDPHTAVASRSYGKYLADHEAGQAGVTISTASPYKFPATVLEAIGQDASQASISDRLASLRELSGLAYPQAIQELESAPVRDKDILSIDQMEDQVLKIVED